MNGRFKLSKAEITEERLLDMEESLEALRYIGIDDVSVHLVRQYQTRRLINRPQIGPDKRAGAKYRGYFSAAEILAIADIRLRLKNGETLDEIGFETRSLFKEKLKLHNLERRILRVNLAALPLFDELRTDMIVDADSMQQIRKLIELIVNYKEEKERIELKTLGQNLDPGYSEKLEEFLDMKFANG